MVDANTYGTVAGVQRLIGDIVASRTFSTETVPTLAQCEAELDAVAAELNALLDYRGYSAPVLVADYPFAFNALKAANIYGASARLLATVPGEGFDPDEQVVDQGATRAQMYERYLNQMKKQINEYKLRATMRKGRFNNMIAGGATDEDGNTRCPIFKRGDLDHPGTVSDTEDE